MATVYRFLKLEIDIEGGSGTTRHYADREAKKSSGENCLG
jgi:hypothetical protein